MVQAIGVFFFFLLEFILYIRKFLCHEDQIYYASSSRVSKLSLQLFHINQIINKQKIQHRQNSSKINSNNPRNRGQIDTLNTNIHDRSPWLVEIITRVLGGTLIPKSYSYLCNQCLSPLMLWVRISIRARCTTLCDISRWF
jgi:hypothetical protein